MPGADLVRPELGPAADAAAASQCVLSEGGLEVCAVTPRETVVTVD